MTRRLPLVAAALVAFAVALLTDLAPVPAPAEARAAAPRLLALRCVPPTRGACRVRPTVAIGKQVQLRGRRLRRGLRVTFRWSRGALATRLRRTRAGWVVRVPAGVRTGTVRVYVTDRAGRRSNVRRLRVAPAQPRVTRPSPAPAGAVPDAFTGKGMWIWEIPRTERGDLAAIAERARATGVATVFVKSGDGTDVWEQFSPGLVQTLHAAGVRVCGWQFVYGDDPVGEARVAAASVAAGADCFVIDAESRYEGRYAEAQRYVRALRAAVGPAFPIGLTSFPYVDYHPRLPYSVFLGPGGAQANLPQVYWRDIGGSVDAVSAHTFAHNRIYKVPIAPIGQTYGSPRADEIARFRAVWAAYGSPGYSWWSWQATPASLWHALEGGEPPPAAVPDPGWPAPNRNAGGDQVVWLQQHLRAADPSVTISGRLDAATAGALAAFQTARGLPATGSPDPATWQALLALQPVEHEWSGGR